MGLMGWEEQSSGLKGCILQRGSGLQVASCITLLFIGHTLVTALCIRGGTEIESFLSHQVTFPFSLPLYFHMDQI